MIRINIGDSDEKADWLKLVADGRYQKEDLEAHRIIEERLSVQSAKTADQPEEK